MPIEKRNTDVWDCRAMQKVLLALNLAHLERPSFAEYLIPQKCSWKHVALAIPTLLFVLSIPSFGQTLKVDGSAAPASIPDAIAERFILHEMATKTKTPLNKKLKPVGLSTADAMAFGVNVMAFGDDYAKAIPKDAFTVVQRYMAQLGKALSPRLSGSHCLHCLEEIPHETVVRQQRQPEHRWMHRRWGHVHL